MAIAHPCTLFAAARALLQPTADAQGQHLQAQAACLLGNYERAHRLWEALAHGGDREALARLAELAQRGAPVFSGPRYPR